MVNVVCFYILWRKNMKLKKSKILKRIPVLLLVMTMALSTCFGLNFKAYAIASPTDASSVNEELRYNGGYSISGILSKYNYFVYDDLVGTSTSHIIGSVIVGGILDLSNSFGRVKSGPSYAYKIKNLSDYQNDNFYKGLVEDSNLYYVEKDDKLLSWNSKLSKVGKKYFDREAAFSAIKSESINIANNSDSKDNSSYKIDKNNTMIIDCANHKFVNIASDDFNSVSKIILDKIDKQFIINNELVISITGGDVFLDTSKIYIENTSLNNNFIINYLRKMGQDIDGGQYYPFGLNLIWNIPDATSVVTNCFVGHIVAPKAIVTFGNGNFEGGVIAKSVYSDAEAHFYPSSKPFIPEVPTTEEPRTQKPTTEVDARVLGAIKTPTFQSTDIVLTEQATAPKAVETMAKETKTSDRAMPFAISVILIVSINLLIYIIRKHKNI